MKSWNCFKIDLENENNQINSLKNIKYLKKYIY